MRIFFVFLVVFISNFTIAQNAYRFRNYTISDGLSQSAISTIIQDNIGSIWIGTQDGLNRFDGQTFETFTPDNTLGIENGDFLSAIKSANGLLWFGTSNGLTQYDPNTEIFKTYLAPNQEVLQVKSIVEDKKGNIWIGSYNAGILLFNAKTKKINKVKEAKLPTEKILYITLISTEELLISTEDKGIFIYHIPKQKSYPIYAKAKTDKQFKAYSIKTYDQNEWIICSNQGLYFLNKRSKKIRPCYRKLDDTYGWLEIHDILILNEHKFIITSKSEGLFTL